MYGLTKPQKLILDMERYVGGAIAVVCGCSIRKGSMDNESMEKAINEIVRINDSLRTKIHIIDGEVYQSILPFERQTFDVLTFIDKEELDSFCNDFSKEPILLDGKLYDIKIVVFPGSFGILAKMHHIISDAWTISLLATQFFSILDGNVPTIYQYEEYAVSEQDYLCSSRYQKDRTYFLEQFRKCDQVTYLSDRKEHSFQSNRIVLRMSREESRLISEFAAANGVSPFTVFMASLAVYISRIKMNANNFYIGTAVLNRANLHERNTMGMFINSAPVLIELDYEASFVNNVRAIHGNMLPLFRHQKYNYNDVLADVHKEFGFSEPLYDVVLSYQNAKIDIGGNSESTWYHNGLQTESLQMHIDDRDSEGYYRILYDYQTDKFTEDEIKRLHKNLCHLLFDGISHNERKLYELDLLSEDELRRVIKDLNSTAEDYPKDKCIHTLFDEQAMKTPEDTAVIACDRTLNYAELDAESNRIANSLIERGVRIGDIVAFAMPRESRLISVMLGILKAGAVYLPIDPDYPQERIDYMLSDSGAKELITESGFYELNAHADSSNPHISLSGDSVCYCIYTSGSTGKPKGALIRHRGVVNLSCPNNHNMITAVKKNCKSILSIGSVTFDIFSTEVLLSILNGLTVVVASDDDIRNPGNLGKLITKYNVDGLYCTPSKLSLYLSNQVFKTSFQRIQIAFCAGEPLTALHYRQFSECFDGLIFNGYGPTETTMGVSFGLIDSDDIHIGKPMANTQIYILDKYLNPIPIGMTGELCVAGDGVGAGYLKRPDLTRERFVDNPFGEGKLYKTGDLAYWREDGNIAYVGRNDFQIKIRGLRIETGEIESALSTVDGISQVIVVDRKDDNNRQFICAFYTGVELPANELRKAIANMLPKYMLPHVFVHLDAIPLTPTGKVDRKALSQLELENCETEYIPPVGNTEVMLTSLMEKILQHSPIGRDDDFFDLGGDSLSAIALISALEAEGYHTDFKAVFSQRSVREIAAVLTRVPYKEEIKIVDSDEFPASPAQMRVYTAQAMQGGTAYNMPFAFRAESVDTDRLERAINAMIQRHDSLRTRFIERDGKVFQVVVKMAQVKVERLTNSDLSLFISPFDLSKAPLLRAGVIGNTVVFDMHHIISDGASLTVFFRELNELYMGRELPAHPAQYRQYAALIGSAKKDMDYWLKAFADVPETLSLNTEHKHTDRQRNVGRMLYDSIDCDLHKAVLGMCHKVGITAFGYYIAAFYILLAKLSGNEDITVGIPVSGRDGPFLNTIGMFVNTVALRANPSGEKTIAQFLLDVQTAVISAIEHQNFSYSDLLKKLKTSNSLFNVMFVYQDSAMLDIVFGDKKASVLPVQTSISKYDFTFNVIPSENGAVLAIEYCDDLFSQETIKRYSFAYRTILSKMLNTGIMIRDLSALTESEKSKLFEHFNDTVVLYDKNECVHTCFENNARQNPERTALTACDRRMTYRQLNEEANRIAHSLIERGIGRNDIVAFSLPRKSFLISTMLGILKSGAAYLPIDPDYPHDRISYILIDSDAKLLVTESELNDLLSNPDTSNPKTECNGTDCCYCLYTSGSTGQPKGTLVSHGNIRNFVGNNSKNEICHLMVKEGYTRVLSITTVSFDIFTTESLLPLANGLEVVLANEAQSHSQRALEKMLSLYRVDVLQTTPTKMKLLISDKRYLSYLKGIKLIILGGEALDRALRDELKLYTKARIFNIYGPTEATVWCSVADVSDCDITIGKPIANTQIYIVDKYMKPVPIDVIGELCVAGDGVGMGYLNQPEMTSERFIDNPFGKGKLYKTGDLAYWRGDGNIVFVGRNDYQVKIRGLRIELGEIENALSALEGITQAAVVVRKNDEGRQLICAFYTGGEIEPGIIRANIGKRLPKYMLPHVICHLEKMPMTPSGKTNRRALPEVSLTVVNEFIPPESDLQRKLCDAFAQTLGLARVGITDDFFDLGGDSLRAIELICNTEDMGIHIGLQQVFEYPTVKSLSVYLELDSCNEYHYAPENFDKYLPLLNRDSDEYAIPEKQPLGNVFLTGATGFLGAHILNSLLKEGCKRVYCLVRNDADRLALILKHYFGNQYVDDSRIVPIIGDLDSAALLELPEKIDLVIHTAAKVAHYGSYLDFHRINVAGTQNVIELAKRQSAKLIYISTASVSGADILGNVDARSAIEKSFSESDLYIGQKLDNVYIRSKFLAECIVLDAALDGLPVNIIRLGNLTNRRSDGMFQPNYETNAFINRVKAVIELGCFPEYLIDMYAEFSQIDDTASAVVCLAEHFTTERLVYHVYNNKHLYFRDLLPMLGSLGFPINVVPGKVFARCLAESSDPFIRQALINDMDANGKWVLDSNIRVHCEKTVGHLKRIGFRWHEIDIDYLRKFMEYFRKIGYIL